MPNATKRWRLVSLAATTVLGLGVLAGLFSAVLTLETRVASPARAAVGFPQDPLRGTTETQSPVSTVQSPASTVTQTTVVTKTSLTTITTATPSTSVTTSTYATPSTTTTVSTKVTPGGTVDDRTCPADYPNLENGTCYLPPAPPPR